MNIRTKHGLVFALALAITLGIGLYAFDFYSRATSRAAKLYDHSARIETASLTAQVHFKKQVQEWKNILLRGQERALYDQYLGQFFDQEELTRSAIEDLIDILKEQPDAKKTAQEFLAAHLRLGKEYRKALRLYDATAATPHLAVDRQVRGIDREPTDLLDKVVASATSYKARQLAAIATTVARVERNILIIVITTMTAAVILILWLLDRSVGRPIATATAVAKRISEGDLSNKIEIKGRDEAGQLLQALDTMQASLAKYQKSLRQGEERTRLLLDSSGEGIYGVDLKGHCTFCNPTALRLLGYKNNSQLLGRQIHDMMHHTRPDGSRCPIEKCKASQTYRDGRPAHVDDEVFWRPDGSSFPVEYRSHPIRQEGRLIGAVVTFSDITERKRTLGALNKAHADLEKERSLLAKRVDKRTRELHLANTELARIARAKDEFLAIMSHELRTPLTAILGISEMLGDRMYGSLNEQQAKAVETVHESGNHLLSLINDVLDVVKMDAGKMKLAWDAVPVEQLCEASLRLIHQSALRKHISVSSSIDPRVRGVSGDSRRLKQLLVNLLGNAVKFTPEGKEIGLEVEGDPKRKRVCFSVWDTGIGIPEEQQHRLFKPFVQLDSRIAREYNGTGLGLTLVYSIAELHGGSVSLESALGKGSRFNIYLPWESETGLLPKLESEPGQAEKALAENGFKGCRILLAEDNRANATMLAAYLEQKDYQVTTVRDGVEAIAAALDTHPDIILMDVQLPTMNGLEATRKIRAHPTMANTPIIALTALAMPGDRERCLEAGISDYMSKPVGVKELHQKIQQWLLRT